MSDDGLHPEEMPHGDRVRGVVTLLILLGGALFLLIREVFF